MTFPKGGVKATFNVDQIINIDSYYSTSPLRVELHLCNRAYAPETAAKTKCVSVAEKSLKTLAPGESHRKLKISGGARKVKKGSYKVVLFLLDQKRTGVYDWFNFSKTIKIK